MHKLKQIVIKVQVDTKVRNKNLIKSIAFPTMRKINFRAALFRHI